ncbi:hypothetical protein BDV33DRAFT_180022 [Aspergillus novoparasiticus]|uniref:Uncharacterized protein n=1 Tax=Aspergillus novoparasiticus TaxID=986946 RepID=A0A5N6EE24_9EURO|nr:hypothetical protein BDV33DRAFT_180022 [Aspergillus novoparasiticus]
MLGSSYSLSFLKMFYRSPNLDPWLTFVNLAVYHWSVFCVSINFFSTLSLPSFLPSPPFIPFSFTYG